MSPSTGTGFLFLDIMGNIARRCSSTLGPFFTTYKYQTNNIYQLISRWCPGQDLNL